MADAVVKRSGSRRGKQTSVYLFEQEIDRSIYKQLNKLNARYTCKILVEGVIKRPKRNYNQFEFERVYHT